MLIVLASRFDAAAAALVERWRQHGARLLTCEGLSQRGWRFDPADCAHGEFVLEGERLPVRSLQAVVSLLAGVTPHELPQFVAEEREYAASEMTAFLLAWLSSLPCRVMNRPTPLNLAGPRLHPEQWLSAAARAGLEVRGMHRRAPSFERPAPGGASSASAAETPPSEVGEPAFSLAVVAGRCIAAPAQLPLSDDAVAGIRRLADAARAELLTVHMATHGAKTLFCGASPMVDVSRDDVADAMLHAVGVRT